MSPNPRHLILNLLLGTESGSLSAREAVASCALFGVRESSTRVALARLAAEGLLTAASRGAYQLGPQASDIAQHVARWRHVEQRMSAWNGGWITVHVGGLGRSDRVALRARARALSLLGFGELERGLHLRPDNLVGGVEALRSRLLALGLEPQAVVFVARELEPARERQARALWDGMDLNHRYLETRQRLDHWLAGAARLSNEVAAREAFELGDQAIHDLVFDPLLPTPLVDVAARQAFVDAVVRFDAAGHAIWKQFLDAQRPVFPAARRPAARQPSLETSP